MMHAQLVSLPRELCTELLALGFKLGDVGLDYF
jgi:hypothetical protein